MPTYDYECRACGKTIEVFQSIAEAPKKKCPACGKSKLQRLIGPGAGFIFKGSGFYITDYRSSDYKEQAKAEAGTAKTDAKAGDAKAGDAKGGDAKGGTKKEGTAGKDDSGKKGSKRAGSLAPT